MRPYPPSLALHEDLNINHVLQLLDNHHPKNSIGGESCLFESFTVVFQRLNCRRYGIARDIWRKLEEGAIERASRENRTFFGYVVASLNCTPALRAQGDQKH